MTPAEVEAKADELRAKLQAIASMKVGWGLDGVFRQVLQAAFDLVGLVRELARLVGQQPQTDQSDK